MAGFEQRPGSGTLFRNESDNPKAPAYRGELCLEDGRVIKLAGWVKDGRKGKFLSLSIDKPRDGQADSFRGQGPAPVAGSDRDDPFADEVPF